MRTTEDVEEAAIYPADAIVADTGQGGSGQVGNWELARRLALRKPVVLAGGITAKNACAGFKATSAFAVDCSSGIEASPGIKDFGKLMDFANACNETNYLLTF